MRKKDRRVIPFLEKYNVISVLEEYRLFLSLRRKDNDRLQVFNDIPYVGIIYFDEDGPFDKVGSVDPEWTDPIAWSRQQWVESGLYLPSYNLVEVKVVECLGKMAKIAGINVHCGGDIELDTIDVSDVYLRGNVIVFGDPNVKCGEII
ncbi:MAG: hypothetical protein GY861_21035 [bacterium]|nr:hypothetical protein [bacterium]